MNFWFSSTLKLLVLITLLDNEAEARNSAINYPALRNKDAVNVVDGAAFATAGVGAVKVPRLQLLPKDSPQLQLEDTPSNYAKRFSSFSNPKKAIRRRRVHQDSRRSRRSLTGSLSSASTSVASISDRTAYHSNRELVEAMNALSLLYPNMTHLYSIGTSVKGVKLFALAIAGEKPKSHVILRPEMKYVGNMHGNEVVGRELIIRYAKYLLENYARLTRVRHLLDNARIHLLPTMNPDGFSSATLGECGGVRGRTNGNNYDLNRNFPDHFDSSHNPIRQPETQSLMDWAKTTQFVISANMHGGAVVANYPFDNNKGGFYTYSASPDDDVFRALASTYAAHNPPMLASTEFKGGITNGAAWYPLPGGMQDWMYLQAGCMELTLEVSDCKYPPFRFIERFWQDNRDSMTALLYRGFVGVKGVVKDVASQPLVGVEISVLGRPEVKMKTTSDGEFWRLLMPGKHVLKLEAECCLTKRINVTVAPTDGGDFDTKPVSDNQPLEIVMQYHPGRELEKTSTVASASQTLKSNVCLLHLGFLTLIFEIILWG